MPLPAKIHLAVEASRTAPDFFASEDYGCLRLGGRLSDVALAAWQVVHDEDCEWLTLECLDSVDDEIAPGDSRPGDLVRLTLTFEPAPDAAHLFTPEGWRTLLTDDDLMSSTGIVRLAFCDEGFTTRAFVVEHWDGAPEAGAPAKAKPDTSPRRHVRSQSPGLMAPSRIEPWLLAGDDRASGTAWRLWNDMACVLVARSLANELYRDGGQDRVVLAGQPSRRLDFGASPPEGAPFPTLQRAASWVYCEGIDVEVRHTFLTAELAREWSSPFGFCEALGARLGNAHESAALLYKAHLRGGSKDTLKALADLRKTLSDEVQKLLQQAKDLSAGVWRDVAIAVGVLAVRVAVSDAGSPKPGGTFAWVYGTVALYIALSYWMAVATNDRFLRLIETSRVAWRTKLYAFLDDADYSALAEAPLSDAVAGYRRTERLTSCVVGVTVLILVVMALTEAELVDPARWWSSWTAFLLDTYEAWRARPSK